MNSKWKTISSKIDYENKWIKITKNIRRHQTGKESDFFFASFNLFTKVIAANSLGEIALIKNYRYLIDSNQIELPAGGIESGEDIALSALRELKEEAGIVAKNTKILGEFYTTIGISDQKGYAVLATDLALEEPEFDEFEEIEPVKFYSVPEIKRLIAKNILTDGPSVTALSIYFNQYGL